MLLNSHKGHEEKAVRQDRQISLNNDKDSEYVRFSLHCGSKDRTHVLHMLSGLDAGGRLFDLKGRMD